MQDAIEKKRTDFEAALKKHSEYSDIKIKQKNGFFLVGERFITPKGKFEILDIDSGYNEALGERDWLLTIENYNNFVRMTIWYSDLLQRYEAGQAVLITFKS